MPMDEQVFFFVNIFEFILLVAGFLGDERWAFFPFIGGIIGAWFLTALGDGLITVAYAYQNGFQTSTMSDAQLIYIPVLMTLGCFGSTIWRVLDGFRLKTAGVLSFAVMTVGTVAYGIGPLLTNLDTVSLANVGFGALTLIQSYIVFLAVGTAVITFVGIIARTARFRL